MTCRIDGVRGWDLVFSMETAAELVLRSCATMARAAQVGHRWAGPARGLLPLRPEPPSPPPPSPSATLTARQPHSQLSVTPHINSPMKPTTPAAPPLAKGLACQRCSARKVR